MFSILFWLYISLSVVLVVVDAVRDWKESILLSCCNFRLPRGAVYLILIVLAYPAIHVWVYTAGFIRNRRNRNHA